MKKIVFFAICSSFITFIIWQGTHTSTPITSENLLLVGTSPDYPPYAQVDLATGKIIGLEIDIVQEIATRLDKKLVIKTMPFSSLIVSLISGHIDLIAAGMTPTSTRKKNILFSSSYIDNDENIVITKNSGLTIASQKDLYGKKIAVNLGYTADSYLSTDQNIDLIRLKSPADGFIALQSGTIDAFVVARSIYQDFMQHAKIDDNAYKIYTLEGSADSCALAFSKYNTKLQEQVNGAIDAMQKDGSLHTILQKWGF